MNVRIEELMNGQPISAQPFYEIEQVQATMKEKGIHFMPIVDGDQIPVGCLSSADFLQPHPDGTQVHKVMTEKVFSIPQYENVEIAARMMRNHKIHHLVVTHEQKLVGVLSSFDLLKLIEGKRFVAKNPGSDNKHKHGKRNKTESHHA